MSAELADSLVPLAAELAATAVIHSVGDCWGRETSRETSKPDTLRGQDATPRCANTKGAANPAGTSQNLGATQMIPPPSVRLAAHLVNAAHAQLAHARRTLSTALEHRATQPGRKPGECGTPAGYRRHQRATDAPCWACVEANNWDERRRRRRAA